MAREPQQDTGRASKHLHSPHSLAQFVADSTAAAPGRAGGDGVLCYRGGMARILLTSALAVGAVLVAPLAFHFGWVSEAWAFALGSAAGLAGGAVVVALIRTERRRALRRAVDGFRYYPVPPPPSADRV